MTVPRQIQTTRAAQPTAAYSQAMAHGELVATGGQVGRDPITEQLAPDLESQVAVAIENLRAVVEAAGGDLTSVIKTSCFLADVAQFDIFDTVYRRYFKNPYPARSTVGVALAGGLLFEIEAWAVMKKVENAETV